ncbi:7954_t:CDS:1, partial [Dentiscutata erythropus]
MCKKYGLTNSRKPTNSTKAGSIHTKPQLGVIMVTQHSPILTNTQELRKRKE